jgi:membrane-bound lytic murein transglycosylase D
VKKSAHYLLSLILSVSAVLFLSGCAVKTAETPQTSHELESFTVPSLADIELNATFSAEYPVEANGETEEIPLELEQSTALELEGLQSLGQWEEGQPADDTVEAEIEYDFPITINRQVEYYLDFFQNRNREVFTRWLERSGAYRAMIEEHLQEAGLPRDLVYLAMIESGFSQTARSKAKAVGMWQFIKGTANNYGLKVNSYVDERRDFVKSTKAAVEYLSDLYAEFGSWYLAVAGYNAGEGKIRRAIQKHNSTNFWELAQGSYLKLETKRYVPKLIAAIIIAKNPEKYGFTDVRYQDPFAYETIETPRWTSLKAVALACDVDVTEMQNFNRELLKPFTPPDSTTYSLKLPVGKQAVAEKNLSRVHAVVSTNYKTHVVQGKETLDSVCRKYGLTKTIMLKANNLQKAKLSPGQRLRVPYRTTQYELLPEGGSASRLLAASDSGENLILHKILPGETVLGLAERYNVPAHLIAGWNDLKDISRIRAGQQLAIYTQNGDDAWATAGNAASQTKAEQKTATRSGAQEQELGDVLPSGESGKEMMNYLVRRGDSLWTIARKFEISVDEIRSWNNLGGNLIWPGTRLLIAVNSTDAPQVVQDEKGIYYLVRGGDSLWTIAKKFKQPMEKIREWNNLADDIIYPGNRLLVRLAEADA